MESPLKKTPPQELDWHTYGLLAACIFCRLEWEREHNGNRQLPELYEANNSPEKARENCSGFHYELPATGGYLWNSDSVRKLRLRQKNPSNPWHAHALKIVYFGYYGSLSDMLANGAA